jgi:hypothetical protein
MGPLFTLKVTDLASGEVVEEVLSYAVPREHDLITVTDADDVEFTFRIIQVEWRHEDVVICVRK